MVLQVTSRYKLAISERQQGKGVFECLKRHQDRYLAINLQKK